VIEAELQADAKSTELNRWRKRILISLWITYSTFYLRRVNMSIAVPGIMGEFGYSKTAMGGVMTALLVAYAAGQLRYGCSNR